MSGNTRSPAAAIATPSAAPSNCSMSMRPARPATGTRVPSTDASRARSRIPTLPAALPHDQVDRVVARRGEPGDTGERIVDVPPAKSGPVPDRASAAQVEDSRHSRASMKRDRGERVHGGGASRSDAQAENSSRILPEDESLGLVAEVRAVAHGRNGPREDRVVVGEIGGEKNLVRAHRVDDVTNVVLVGVERDVALTVEVLAGLSGDFWNHPPDLLV